MQEELLDSGFLVYECDSDSDDSDDDSDDFDFDETHLDAPLTAEGGQVDQLVVVDAALDDGVDLDGVETGRHGGIDPGESGLRALHREVFEETGWIIGNARRLGAYRRFAFMPNYGQYAEKLCHIWIARPILRLSAPTELHHSARWASPRAAMDLLGDPGARAFLARFRHVI